MSDTDASGEVEVEPLLFECNVRVDTVRMGPDTVRELLGSLECFDEAEEGVLVRNRGDELLAARGMWLMFGTYALRLARALAQELDPGSDGLHTYSAQLAYDNGQFGDETVAARTALTALAPDGARLEDRRDRSSRVDLLAVLCVFVARCVREAAAIPAHPAPRWH